MDALELQRYLHRHIPLSACMGVEVREASAERVELSAPLEPNINHRETVFGGSASAVAILAAWGMVRIRLESEGIPARIVIQRNSMEYLAPITGPFLAVCPAPASEEYSRFLSALRRKGRARLAVDVRLECEDVVVGEFSGWFVAISMEGAARQGG